MRKIASDPVRRAALARLLALGGCGTLAGTLGRDAQAAGAVQGMVRMRGSVTIDGQPASVGQQIQPGQVVETGADGEAVFVIDDDAFLQHAGSRFSFRRSAGVTVLRYLTGKILSVFGKGRKTLQTPTATIGIRGTACFIIAEARNTYFCLCYGGAVIRPRAAPGVRRVLRTRHHEQPLMIGMGATPIAPASVTEHTDTELVMLEELVGRVPPFQGQGYTAY